MIRSLFICVTCLLAYGCAKTIETYNTSDKEKITSEINGLTYSVPKHLTAQQKEVLAEIVDNMICVKGGIYLMGAPFDIITDATTDETYYPLSNESPVRYVRLSDFWISKHEISPKQISTILGKDFSDAPDWTYQDWELLVDVLKFQTELTFDFPTEAQWEYAAKGGEYTKGYLFPGSDNLKDVRTSEIDILKTKAPNELGIFNMADHYSEWCKDKYRIINEYQGYPTSPLLTDPLEKNGKGHVVRGGNYTSSWYRSSYNSNFEDYSFQTWKDEYRISRSTSRLYHDGASKYIGFRPVLNIK